MINIEDALNTVPFFLYELEDLEIIVGEEFKVGLDFYADIDEMDEHELVLSLVDGEEIPSFMKIEKDKLLLFPEQDSEVGEYPIRVIVWDNNSGNCLCGNLSDYLFFNIEVI